MALIDSLVSYWKIDEASGNAIDAHGGNDGTIRGATPGSTGIINDCYIFDGTNDTIDSTSDNGVTDGSNVRSVSVWFQIGSGYTPADDGLFAYGTTSSDDAFGMAVWNASTIRFYNWNTDYNVSVGAMGNTWHNYIAVYDGTNMKIYFDGSLVDTRAKTITTILANYWEMGDVLGGFSKYWNGLIDEVGIWGRALIQSDVTALYNSGNGLAYPFAVPGKMDHYRRLRAS